METLHIELDIEVEDQMAKAYQRVSNEVNPQLMKRVKRWLEQQIQGVQESEPSDPWLEFLDNIDHYAVDTGITDFSINHEYYLYGGPKRQ
jgi:hypothetical protein